MKKLRSNAKKKFLVDGGILYRQADKLYPLRRRTIDADEFFDSTSSSSVLNVKK